MRFFGFFWRAMLAIVVFLAVGVFTDRAITAHAIAHGTSEGSVRMAAAMAGLFGGGSAAVVLGIAMFLLRPREPEA